MKLLPSSEHRTASSLQKFPYAYPLPISNSRQLLICSSQWKFRLLENLIWMGRNPYKLASSVDDSLSMSVRITRLSSLMLVILTFSLSYNMFINFIDHLKGPVCSFIDFLHYFSVFSSIDFFSSYYFLSLLRVYFAFVFLFSWGRSLDYWFETFPIMSFFFNTKTISC
jgi:hypothetical protein